MSSSANRRSVPGAPRLGLLDPGAHAGLEQLGWNTLENEPVLWALSRAADPDACLKALIGIKYQLEREDHNQLHWGYIDQLIRHNKQFRGRLFGLLGASNGFVEHCQAHPQSLLLLLFTTDLTFPEFDHELKAVVESSSDYGPSIIPVLRKTYRNMMMMIAARDLASTVEDEPVMSITQVGQSLSDLTDAALSAALRVSYFRVSNNKSGPLPAIGVIALGKCGARELNYVSDIDVIFVAEPANALSDRIAGEMIRIASLAFSEVDAGLRPEGRHGALTRSLLSHQNYYEKWAQSWEFQALIKARPMCGDIELARDFCEHIAPLVWEASLRTDFIDDMRAMKNKVEKSIPSDMQARELKLGVGGLRDVEFSVQMLQLVHGRTDESLRASATLPALDLLGSRGYVSRDDAANFAYSYEFLRLIEHRLQLESLRRTHTLPPLDDSEALRVLARSAHVSLNGEEGPDGMLLRMLRKHHLRVRTIHEKLFYQPLLDAVIRFNEVHAEVASSASSFAASEEAVMRQLYVLGFNRPEEAFSNLRFIVLGSPATPRLKRHVTIHHIVFPTLLEWLSRTPDPDRGLGYYRRILEAITGDQRWFMRLIRDEPLAAQRLMKIVGTSTFVAELLVETPAIIRSYVESPYGPELLNTSARSAAMAITAACERAENSESAIMKARTIARLELARLASADTLGMLNVTEVCSSLSLLRAAMIQGALQAVLAEDLRTRTAPASIAVIAMGRLGGWESSYASDADVLFVCEAAPGFTDEQAIKWSTGIVEKIRYYLSKPGSTPPLDIDVDLRPEGKSGPLVRSLKSYTAYYQKWAEAWEVQALLRANYLAGNYELGLRFLWMIDNFRYPEGGISEDYVKEIRRIKARVSQERLPRGADPNTHTKLGRGGLADIEWTAQLMQLKYAHKIPALHTTSTLDALQAIGASELLPEQDVAILREAWITVSRARDALILVKGKNTDQLPISGDVLTAVAALNGWEKNDAAGYLNHYLNITRRARDVVLRVFGSA